MYKEQLTIKMPNRLALGREDFMVNEYKISRTEFDDIRKELAASPCRKRSLEMSDHDHKGL